MLGPQKGHLFKGGLVGSLQTGHLSDGFLLKNRPKNAKINIQLV
jgi:hypothetical protein